MGKDCIVSNVKILYTEPRKIVRAAIKLAQRGTYDELLDKNKGRIMLFAKILHFFLRRQRDKTHFASGCIFLYNKLIYVGTIVFRTEQRYTGRY